MREQRILQAALSRPRWATYKRIAYRHCLDAASLYVWNMQMCGALLSPLHICEIVIRNAVAAALAHTFGPRWPWHPALLQRMPADGALSALQDIHRQADPRMDTPEIIASLRFAFWQQLFTRHFEGAIWARGLKIALPNAPQDALSVVRTNIHADLDRIRHLRNRIAHHEPILERDIGADLAAIGRLIHARCPHTLGWLQRHERATTVLAASPLAVHR
ncbi:hypothetical protein [uncultured Stenotrophomonas sp.]|uniref:hypothetical protein n=1 Tax=Stenotrophomonas maltophilia TaxID=40324 RepID=UPI00258B24DD|nr:hypothetical protein [uncultured Stenotrophomonas sp.]